MLSDFFRINLPYGMKKNSDNEWLFFNREYIPLGWNTNPQNQSIYGDSAFAELPVYTKYKKLTEPTLSKLAWDDTKGVKRNSDGEIEMVFFYNDETNPQSNSKYWSQYFDKIKLLSKCDIANSVR
jgi:hypothetical protein